MRRKLRVTRAVVYRVILPEQMLKLVGRHVFRGSLKLHTGEPQGLGAAGAHAHLLNTQVGLVKESGLLIFATLLCVYPV